MRINEYNSIDEFIDEYSSGKSFSWQNDDHKERFMGIEFLYNGIYYRMCREPAGDECPILADGSIGQYDIMMLDCKTYGYPKSDKCILLGWYKDLDDLMENCFIEKRKFKDVIMDDRTEILGKD